MAAKGKHSGEVLDPPVLIGGNQELLSQDMLCCASPRVVKIPCKMTLGLMLQELTLPRARYDFHKDTHGRVTTVVTFYSFTRMPDNLLRVVKLGGVEAVDYEAAEESAAREAIRFVESWENMEVEDLHYSELKCLEANMEDLLEKLGVPQKEKENLQAALSLAASRMVTFSNHIYNIMCNSRSLGQGDTAEDINATIRQFEGVAAELGHVGKRLKDMKDKAFP